MKKCPYCAEDIQDEAIKCRHCGEMITKGAPENVPTASGPTKYHVEYVKGGKKSASELVANSEDEVRAKLEPLGVEIVSIKEAQPESASQKVQLPSRDTVMGCLIVIIVVFVFIPGCFKSCMGSGSKKTSDSSAPTSVDLKANAELKGGMIFITNRDDFDWTNVKLSINSGIFKGGYVYKTRKISAGTTYSIGVAEFAKGDGTRFNIFTTKVQSLGVFCDTPRGLEGFWNGTWE